MVTLYFMSMINIFNCVQKFQVWINKFGVVKNET